MGFRLRTRWLLQSLAVLLLATALLSRALIPVAQDALADNASPFDVIQICTADGVVSIPMSDSVPARGQSHEGCCLGACSVSCCVAPPLGGFIALLEEQARLLKAVQPFEADRPYRHIRFNTPRHPRAPPVMLV